MKVGLVCPFSLSYFGGVQKHVLALQKEFKKQGHDAKILVPRQSPKEKYGPDVLLLGYSVLVPGNASRVDFSWSNPFETDRILRKEKFDLLHFHGLSPFLGWQILESAKTLKTPSVFTVHTNPNQSFLAQNLPFVPEAYFKYIMDSARGIISVSKTANQSVKGYAGPKAVIPNGVDLEKFTPSGEKIARFADGKVNILFVGRLDERKGLMVALKAFKKAAKFLPNLRLLVVGEGPYKPQAEDYVAEENLSEVHFLGAVPESDLPKVYRTASIFCAPSLGGESFGMVLLEALACGVPVLASRIEGYREVLKGDLFKFLFSVGNHDELCSKILTLAKSRALRDNFFEYGPASVAKYSWPNIAQRVLKFYDRV